MIRPVLLLLVTAAAAACTTRVRVEVDTYVGPPPVSISTARATLTTLPGAGQTAAEADTLFDPVGSEVQKAYTLACADTIGGAVEAQSAALRGEIREIEGQLAEVLERQAQLETKRAPRRVIAEAEAEIEELTARASQLEGRLQAMEAQADDAPTFCASAWTELAPTLRSRIAAAQDAYRALFDARTALAGALTDHAKDDPIEGTAELRTSLHKQARALTRVASRHVSAVAAIEAYRAQAAELADHIAFLSTRPDAGFDASTVPLPPAVPAPAHPGIAGATSDRPELGYPIFSPTVTALPRPTRPFSIRKTAPVYRKLWRPFVLERFYASGGNAQFVVTREGLVVFRQKSADFDPTPVAAAIPAISGALVKLAATVASSYVPALDALADGDPDSPMAAPVDLAVSDASAELLAARQERRVAMLDRLADVLAQAATDPAAARASLDRWFTWYQAQAIVED